MAYEKPITIKEAITNIQKKKYVLPSIQREFVWESEQIEKLFDSLLRDYPISTFLFWDVEKTRIKDFQFYEFIQHYHERDCTHNPKASLADDEDVTAILDGQQRLTSLFIALKGSYSEKIKYYSRDNKNAFPKKKLYLNLLGESDNIEMLYDFKFLSEKEVSEANENNYWFEVSKILEFGEYPDVMKYLMHHELVNPNTYTKEQSEFAMNALNNLYNCIHQQGVINFFLEKNAMLDKVLQIFIRTNSGGTKLNYSDLLLSIATAQWQEKDAREEIHDFVDEINKIGQGFDFNKDFVLKSCLVLGDFSDIKFKVDNFTKSNMNLIEKKWDDVKEAINLSVHLISDFGYNRETLTSLNSLIPIAYYLLKLKADNSFRNSKDYSSQRENIRHWLLRVLLKRTFSGTPDNLYPQLRKLINDANGSFPLESIIDFYKGTNKSIIFTNDDIESLCSLQYSNKFTFSALAVIYPELNLKFRFHRDHIYPKKYFTEKFLKKLGLNSDQTKYYLSNYNTLPNLQLLEGSENIQKSSTFFDKWFEDNYKTETSKKLYCDTHCIPSEISFGFSNFEEFFKCRKKIIKQKLSEMLKTSENQ